jgi:ribonuclease HI
VKKGIGEWLPNWIRRGWKTAAGDPVKNKDLWERLASANTRHQVSGAG